MAIFVIRPDSMTFFQAGGLGLTGIGVVNLLIGVSVSNGLNALNAQEMLYKSNII